MTTKAGLLSGEAAKGPARSRLAPRLSERTLFALWVLVTVPVAAFIMGPSIPNGLVVDDFWWLWRLGPLHEPAWGLISGASHYSPTIQLILSEWYQHFGLDGAPYHVLSVAAYWLGAIAVAWLGWELTGNLFIGLAAGTGVLINHQPAQAYVWAVGIWYTFSTIFYVIGFAGYLASIRSLDEKGKVGRGYCLYLAGLVLGILTHEQGLTLVGVTLLHTVLLVDRVGARPLRETWPMAKLLQRVRFFALPTALTVTAVVARLLVFRQNAAQILPQFPYYEAWVSILRSFLPGLSRPLAIKLTLNLGARLGPETTGQLILFLVQLAVLVIAFVLVERWYKFLLLWTAAQVVTLLYGLGFLFPRHYYLATVPSILLWSSAGFALFKWVNEQLEKRRVALKPLVLTALVGVVAFVFLLTQLPEHRAFQESWQVATYTSTRTFQTLKRLADANPSADKLVLLNLPDTLISSNREWIGVFNVGAAEAVQLYLPGRFKSVVLMRTPLDQYPAASSGLPPNLTQPHLPNLYYGAGEDVSFEEVSSLTLDPSNLVAYFNTSSMEIARVAPQAAR